MSCFSKVKMDEQDKPAPPALLGSGHTASGIWEQLNPLDLVHQKGWTVPRSPSGEVPAALNSPELRTYKPCAGDVPKLFCGAEETVQSSGLSCQRSGGCCSFPRRWAQAGRAYQCWACARWLRPISFRNPSKPASPEALLEHTQQGTCF